ncbi:MAG: hypothetical protein NC400_09005 [Clostridium sp.]|nr:hypothetical protein [Clostridium sp.]
MGISGVKTTEFFAAQNTQGKQSIQSAQNKQGAQGRQSLGRKSFVFTNTTDIGKALATGKINIDGVSVELSEEAMQALEEAREKFYKDRDAETERYVAEFNSYVAKQQGEAYEDMAQDMAKAMETARRIAKGDIVPAMDEKKLMEYDKDLYQMAKTAAMLHQMEKHRKHKSLYEDEEEREYTDPEEETTPMQKLGVEVEVDLGDVPVVESISEGPLEDMG